MKNNISRREFVKRLAVTGAAVCAGNSLSFVAGCTRKNVPEIQGREALFYKKLAGKVVQCGLCPDDCVISPGERGFCRVRENRDGTLFTVAYGNPCAVHVDPIEKKPLFHVLPGTSAFSIATAGCNFRCINCQNWEISQSAPEETSNYDLPPGAVAEQAELSGSATIAYTYSEPVVFYEYMMETAQAGRERGLLNMFHSNGFINEKPLRELSPLIDAADVDLKGMTPEFYEKVCEGELKPVLRTLEILKEEGVWTEVTNLVVPGYNDKPEDFKKLSGWLFRNLGADTPLHISRFYPMYRLKNLAPTSFETLSAARETALAAGLKYVYIGNRPGAPEEHTYCPECSKPVIQRNGYEILKNDLNEGACGFCGSPVPGIWKAPGKEKK